MLMRRMENDHDWFLFVNWVNHQIDLGVTASKFDADVQIYFHKKIS